MKSKKRKKGQEGIAMIIVVCIMAVLVMMSLALLLASSVMTQNSGRVRSEEQARILAVSLADEIEKDITATSGQDGKETSGGILGYVNGQILSGSWPTGEKREFTLDTGSLSTFGQTNDLSAKLMLCYDEGESGNLDGFLSVTVTCTYQNMPFSVTTIYTASTDSKQEETQEEPVWIRSQRR